MRATPPPARSSNSTPRSSPNARWRSCSTASARSSDEPPPTQADMLAWLQALGFRTPKFTRLCRTAEEVMAAIDELDAIRDTLRLRDRRRGDQAQLASNSASASAITRARRSGRRPGNMWPSRRRRGCATSPCRSAAPACSRPSRNSSRSSCAAARSAARRCTTRTRSGARTSASATPWSSRKPAKSSPPSCASSWKSARADAAAVRFPRAPRRQMSRRAAARCSAIRNSPCGSART